MLKQWGQRHYHNLTNICHSADTVLNVINFSIKSLLLSRYLVLQEHWLFGVCTQQPLAIGFAALCVFTGCSTCLSLLVVTAILVQHCFSVRWGFKVHITTHKNTNFSGWGELCPLQHKTKSQHEQINKLIYIFVYVLIRHFNHVKTLLESNFFY